jgi:DNA replication and repair protein RecF
MVLIEGNNGTGKSTLLEAIYYSCFLRSNRTHLPQELVAFDADNFFICSHISQQEFLIQHELTVGFYNKCRSVKLNQQAIGSYKQLSEVLRVVMFSEFDLALITGSPEERRSFIDQALILLDVGIVALFRSYRHVLEQRKKLLTNSNCSFELYAAWTKQMWHMTQEIQRQRKNHIEELKAEMQQLCEQYFGSEYSFSMKYIQKLPSEDTFDDFFINGKKLFEREVYAQRPLFGAHLDDFQILFFQRRSRAFASRGQQKLLVLLLKIAQVKVLQRKKGSCILLLDDFLTDFDVQKMEKFILLLQSLKCQVFLTTPLKESPLHSIIGENAQQIAL